MIMSKKKKEVKILKEGWIKKGGRNPRPTAERPSSEPKPRPVKKKQNRKN